MSDSKGWEIKGLKLGDKPGFSFRAEGLNHLVTNPRDTRINWLVPSIESEQYFIGSSCEIEPSAAQLLLRMKSRHASHPRVIAALENMACVCCSKPFKERV